MMKMLVVLKMTHQIPVSHENEGYKLSEWGYQNVMSHLQSETPVFC